MLKVHKNFYPDLFSWEEFENLINIRPLMNYDRVHFLGKDDYEWDESYWAIDTNCFPAHIIKDALYKGVCNFYDMSRASSKINGLCEAMEKKVNRPVDAHIYASKNITEEHPFGAHWDDSATIIVQCEGITNFKVWYPMELCPGDHLEITRDPIIDCDLHPGDAVFVPTFYPHLATSITHRLSVSFTYMLHDSKDQKFGDREWVKL